MSPLGLRRYRAERVLRDDFDRLRARVTAAVRGRLLARGVLLDGADLEACYAQAWQGMYAILLAGGEIANPAAWLVVVTLRRALDEHRARTRAWGGLPPATLGDDGAARARDGDRSVRRREVADPRGADLAADLEDRERLRALMEAMRCRLTEREREAVSLCYLQGLSRRQAAARMGLSEARMRKLMDGASPRRPGVAGKLGALVADVRDGRWCAEQASMMRALAFGVLDPAGERYRVALVHRRECPACRAYVASLRGLSAALPPVLAPLRMAPWAVSHAAGSAAAAGGPIGGGHASGSAAGAGATAAPGIGAGAAGGIGAAKLAVGCLVALGVGAGCVALGGAPGGPPAPSTHVRGALPLAARVAGRRQGATRAGAPVEPAAPASRAPVAARPQQPGVPASREFTPEQQGAAGGEPGGAPRAGIASTAGAGPRADGGGAGGGAAAEREFSP